MLSTRILGIDEIKIDEELYPRTHPDWKTSYIYSQSMKAGAQFPLITVNYLDGVYWLIDGRHRLVALKQYMKQETIKCEMLRLRDRKAMYKEAIKRNIKNSKPLIAQDKVLIIITLQKMKTSMAEISEIIQMPIYKIKEFKASRVTSTISGEEIILKSPIKHLASEIVDDDVEEIQRHISTGDDQGQIIKQLITLLDKGLINKKNKNIMNNLKILYGLIRKTIYKTRNR